MATQAIVQPASIPGAAGGAVTGAINTGLAPTGNKAGNNQFSPLGGTTPASSMPGAGLKTTVANPMVASQPAAGMATNPGTAQSGTATAPTTPAATPSAATAGDTATQTADVTKQLNDTYGKGEGTLLNNLINNIGSGDSTYMQAYQNAMAGTNAEGLATLDTQMGNSGISANSSTAAIANADYNSNVTSQEGLQEQQLQQQGMQDTVGLVSGMEGQTSAENSTSAWSDLGSVLNGAASNAGSIAKAGETIADNGGLGTLVGGIF